MPGIGLGLVLEKGATAKGFTWSGSPICSYPDAPYETKGFTFDNASVEFRVKISNGPADGGWPAICFLPDLDPTQAKSTCLRVDSRKAPLRMIG